MKGGVDGKINRFGWREISPSDTIFITDEGVFAQDHLPDDFIKTLSPTSGKEGNSKWVEASSLKINKSSQDECFHCDEKIKPKRVRYIKN